MKKLLSALLSITMLIGSAVIPAMAEEEEVTQTVVNTMISDTRGNFCGQWLNTGVYGTTSEGITSDMSYNGTSSYKFTSVKSTMRYMAWTKDADNNLVSLKSANAATSEAITNGTAYICGWFYAERGEKSKTVQMIAEGADKSEIVAIPNERWTYITAKITNLNEAKATNGCVDTNGPGSIYVDDLCVISTSDGSVPVTPARASDAKPGTEPNRYMRVVRELYNDSCVHSWLNGGASVITSNDTTHKKTGEAALKATGTLLFGYSNDNNQVCTLGQISTEITNLVEAGKLYWSAWVYIDTELTSDNNETLDFYIPTNMRTRGEWKWVCCQLNSNNLTQNNMYIKTKGVYTWLDDVKLVTFDELPNGMNFDTYSVSSASDTTLTAGSNITVNVSGYNNSVKGENMSMIFAEYDASGKLVNTSVNNMGISVPFREFAFNKDYTAPNAAGNTVKIILWNMTDGLMPLHDTKTYTIE